MSGPTTSIATSTREDVFVREKSLTKELLGNVSFTEMTFFQILGRAPTSAQTKMLDACLVTLMEHGMTPSVIAARLVYSSAPEAMQAAVAAGVSAVGSVFVGTVEGCAALLERIVGTEDVVATTREAEARRIVEEHRAARRPIPGFGHPLHKPEDPRTVRLLWLAKEEGASGRRCDALRLLSRTVDEIHGKHITVNATGAVAAILADCGVPTEIMRGFAIIARCAGIVGHLHEEQRSPTLKTIWETAERAVPYVPGPPVGG